MKDFITRNKKLKGLLILIFWITLWEILALIINQEIYLPSPVSAFKALWKILFLKETYITIAYSIYRTLAGFLLSCAAGIFLGYFCGINKTVYDFFSPFVNALRSVPIMSIIIIALMWFKSTNVPIFVAFLMCFPIIWVSAVEGIRNTDKKLLEMCKIYKIKNIRIIKSVYYYSALPYIKAAMISALGTGWKVTSAAEVLSLPKYAIGSHLYDSKVYLNIPDLFAWTVIIVALSFIFEKLLFTAFSKMKG